MPMRHSDPTPQATPTGMPAHLAALCAVSRRIGADAALVQGAGGNTSLKRDGVLWVKASGRWLARAADHLAGVPVERVALTETLGLALAEDERGEWKPLE